MILQDLSMAVISTCLLSIWTMGHIKGCGDRQTEINGHCCDMCPPGTYLEEFCSDNTQTLCKPCKEGYFSDQYTIFDRCEPCQSCQQAYKKKCTPTTNAACSCRSGFLCSNSICSICEENKCVTGEKLNKTVISSSVQLVKYSYRCDPLCPENAYFDVKANICRPRAQCSALGLAERFPGNKTHNSVCDSPGMHGNDGGAFQVVLGIGFCLLSLTLLLFLSYTCVKYRRKRKANINRIEAAGTNTSDFHLSKEESGLQLIIQHESKDGNSFGQLHLEEVTTS